MGRASRSRRQKSAETRAVKALAADIQRAPGAPMQVVQQMQASARSGPIPSAAELEEYGRLDPDLPMRIVGWVDTEGAHRRDMEQLAVQAEVDGSADLRRITKRGQFFGLVLGLAAIGGGVVIAWKTGSGISGAGLGVIGFASLIWGPRAAMKAPNPETPK